MVADLLALQHRDEPQLEKGLIDVRGTNAIMRALMRGVSPERLRLLWEWSGSAPDAEVTRKWRRWSSLLKLPLADERLAAADAWDRAGRPRAGPARARQPPEWVTVGRGNGAPERDEYSDGWFEGGRWFPREGGQT